MPDHPKPSEHTRQSLEERPGRETIAHVPMKPTMLHLVLRVVDERACLISHHKRHTTRKQLGLRTTNTAKSAHPPATTKTNKKMRVKRLT